MFYVCCRSEDGRFFAAHTTGEYGIDGSTWVGHRDEADSFETEAEAMFIAKLYNANPNDWRGEAYVMEL